MSSYFVWDPARLSLHIPDMDEDHKVLISLMSELYSLHEQQRPFPEQSKALDKLVRYTLKHFADEEAFMARIGYPDLILHKGVHKRLLDKLADLQSSSRMSGKLPDDLFTFLKMWLSAHICGVDVKYADYAKTASPAKAQARSAARQ